VHKAKVYKAQDIFISGAMKGVPGMAGMDGVNVMRKCSWLQLKCEDVGLNRIEISGLYYKRSVK